MEITKEILEARLVMQDYDATHAGLMESRKRARLEAEITRLALSELERRDEEAGEVVVDGWAESKVFDGVPWEVRGSGRAHAELRFYDLPMPGTVGATVTIRRRAEKAKGGVTNVPPSASRSELPRQAQCAVRAQKR